MADAGSNPAAGDRKRPSKPKLQTRYDAKRLEVVVTAARLFAERGYHATSIDDIVEATGLQRGGLYHYISGKHDLLVAIHERFIGPLLEESRQIQAADLPADEALRQLAYALMRIIAEYRSEVTVFLHEWRAIGGGAEWEKVRNARREFEQIVREVLERGDRTRRMKVRDSQLATMAFLGMMNYTYQWFDPKGSKPADAVAEYFSEIFLYGVAGGRGGTTRPFGPSR